MDIYTSKENINAVENNTSTLNSWSTLPKRIMQQFKQNDSAITHTNEVYNIDNGVLSIRKKDFPQLEVTIGSKTLERRNRGKEINSVILEPLGKTDRLEIGEGISFAEVGLTNKKSFVCSNIYNLITIIIFYSTVSYGKETGGGWKFHYEYLMVQCFLFSVGIANTWRLPSLARAHGDGKNQGDWGVFWS